MLQYVRRNPFHLAPGTDKGKQRDPEWCAEFEQEVRNNEERFWTEKIKSVDENIKD